MIDVAEGPRYGYAAFGLNIASEIRCPEFAPSAGAPEVFIRIADVPERLERPLVQVVTHEGEPGRILLRYPGVARCLLEGGTRIAVRPDALAAEQAISVFLSTSVLGTLLVQRGTFVLHAAACASPRGAVLFAGYSGRGKSTLLSALIARGLPMLADDVSAISRQQDGGLFVLPAYPSIKLFADAVDRAGLDTRALAQIRPNVGKYWVPAGSQFTESAQPIAAVYVLDYHSRSDVEFLQLSGRERFAAVSAHAYSRRLAEGLGLQIAQFPVAAAVAARVPVTILRRPRDLAKVDELADLLIERLR